MHEHGHSHAHGEHSIRHYPNCLMRHSGNEKDCHCEMRFYRYAAGLMGFAIVITLALGIISKSASLLVDGFHALADGSDAVLCIIVLLLVRRSGNNGWRTLGAWISFFMFCAGISTPPEN